MKRSSRPGFASRRTLLKGLGAAGLVGLGAPDDLALGATPITSAFPGRIGLTDADSQTWFLPKHKPPVGAPNVVVILLDDVGFSDIGCYGGDIRTPSLDRIAAEGLRYVNFRTTAVCSATRACLMTGLNHHSAGIGRLTDTDRGYPGYRGDLTHDAATLAELLRSADYGTYHVGKWHLNYSGDSTNTGPMDNWPAQRGFDRTYWFHGHSTDYFRPPEMYDGNNPVDIPANSGYYTTDDFTDRAIDYLRAHRASAPDRPFFLYLAYNGAHSPLQSRPEDRDSYKGAFDKGWDKVREERLIRQKALGIVPPETELPPRNPGVSAWDDLGPEDRKLFARYMEVYAGIVQRLDWNIGRVADELAALGQLENTLLIVASDNGASPEGLAHGTPNMLAGVTHAITADEAMKSYDVMGEWQTMPHYPTGWAMASNTPFRMYKQWTYLGGVSDPLIVHWPQGTKSRGAVRQQYVHVIDIYPTIVDALGIKPLDTYQGRKLKPVEGTSFRHTLDGPAALSRHREQYFEMNSRRAMYADGWHIVTAHRPDTPFADDVWELYDLTSDFNETHNLAASHPEKVKELERKWLEAAKRYDVLPLYNGAPGFERWTEKWKDPPPRRIEIVPPVPRILIGGAPEVLGRDHVITIDLERPRPEDDGVLVAYGNLFTGYVLYIKDGLLVYETSVHPLATIMRSAAPVPVGRSTVKYVQKMMKRPFEGSGALFIDDKQVASLDSVLFGAAYQGLDVGRNGACPVSLNYDAPFPFKGRIAKATIEYDTSQWTAEEMKSIHDHSQYRL